MSEERSVAPEQASAIIEAILLTADAPVTPGRLVALLDEYNGRDIRQLVDSLNAGYADGEHGFSIVEVAGGFQFATRQECGPWLRKFHNDPNQIRLSQAALEALAIVAFKQPVTRIEVDTVRGVNSGGVMQTLMELSMIRIVGRSEGIGKPMLFGTTREFLVHFGLKTLADLPKPRELEELLESGENKAEARQQMAMELQGLQDRAEGQQELAEESDQPIPEADHVDANLRDSVATDDEEAEDGMSGTEAEERVDIDRQPGERSDGDDA